MAADLGINDKERLKIVEGLSKLASIEETAGMPKALDMIKILLEGHEAVTRTARKAFPAAEKAGDQPTMDLLTQRMEVHEKTAWMLRSSLEK
jgi:starvation-inducible DNA-binding protein